MPISSLIKVGQEFDALVCFSDFTGFAANAAQFGDQATSEFLTGAFELLYDRVTAADGVVVKYLGDAALILFPPDGADVAVDAMEAATAELQQFAADKGWNTRLVVAVHYGSMFGVKLKGVEQPDVLGNSVNIAATLANRARRRDALALSAQAFRKLGPATRKRFHRFREPEVYLSGRPQRG